MIPDEWLNALRADHTTSTALAYADWLDERGDAPLAGMIRFWCDERRQAMALSKGANRHRWSNTAQTDDLRGRIIIAVRGDVDNDDLTFTDISGQRWIYYHCQDCCESVAMTGLTGNMNDLIGEPLTVAEERVEPGENDWGSATVTTLDFATTRGAVSVVWRGESNGYYSERVDLRREV